MEDGTYLDKIPTEISAHIWGYVFADERRKIEKIFRRVLLQLVQKTKWIRLILEDQSDIADDDDVYVHKVSEKYTEERFWGLGAHLGRKAVYLNCPWKIAHANMMYGFIRWDIIESDSARWVPRPVENIMEGINIFD